MKIKGKGRPGRKPTTLRTCPKCGETTEILISIQNRDISSREALVYGNCGHVSFGSEFKTDKHINLYGKRAQTELIRYFQRRNQHVR